MIVAMALIAAMWPPQPMPAGARVSDARIAQAATMIGRTATDVGHIFGPVPITTESTCCQFFGYRSSLIHQEPVLVRTYQLTSGGTLSFIYDRLVDQRPWIVVGMVYAASPQGVHPHLDTVLPLARGATKTSWQTCWSTNDVGYVQSTSIMPLGRTLAVRYDSVRTLRAPSKDLPIRLLAYFAMPTGRIAGLTLGGETFSFPAPLTDSCVHGP